MSMLTLDMERSEVYNPWETVISKGQVPGGVIVSFHYLGASPIHENLHAHV
jgi:hypothetical protein